MKQLEIPICDKDINEIKVGDILSLTGKIFAGRDAVLPKIATLALENRLVEYGIDLYGSTIFHTAVSRAGIGPTSSNKFDIENSIPVLSQNGVKIHLGKGKLSFETIEYLKQYNSIYAVTPPVTALFKAKILTYKIMAFPELGVEAFYMIDVKKLPVIVAAAHGESIY